MADISEEDLRALLAAILLAGELARGEVRLGDNPQVGAALSLANEIMTRSRAASGRW